MREKILELLRDQFLISFKMGDNEEKLYQAIADKIMKIAEFEALCNPGIYEAHMNEDIEERERRGLLMEFRGYYFTSGLGVICESDIDGFLDNRVG